MERTLDLPEDPVAALAVLRAASRECPVLVFKRSPICPTSFTAERQLRLFLEELQDSTALRVATVDVIAQKPLARGLTHELGIQHESPQALWFHGGELAWHASHGAITRGSLGEQLA
jgi:bacillithiol system protein YtxJ